MDYNRNGLNFLGVLITEDRDIINGNCVNLTPIICTCYATVSYLIFFSTNLNYAFNIL